MPEELPPCRLTGWAEVDRWAEAVAGQIVAAGSRPTVLVALTRGGWVPARLVADRLGLHRLVSLRAQHWGVTARPSGKAELTEGLSGPVKGEPVLVLDDITDTGESLALATEHVRGAGAERVESGAFLHIEHSRFVPTYFAERIPRDRWVWVVFPWNYWEDLANLGARAMAIAGDPARAVALLEERCGLRVPESDLKRALAPRGPPAPRTSG